MASQLHLTEADAARSPDFSKQVQAALKLPDDARLELQNVAQGAHGELNVMYAATMPIEVQGAEFGNANGVMVDEPMSVSLRFDARGALVSSQVAPADDHHLRLVKDQIKKLAAADQIYPASPSESIDTDALRAQRKPWYIEMDAQGRKRLKRAYMA